MVVFGGTGDLARRKIIPSLFSLFVDGYLSSNFHIIATGRRVHSKDLYIQSLREFLPSHDSLDQFFSHISFFELDVNYKDGFF